MAKKLSKLLAFAAVAGAAAGAVYYYKSRENVVDTFDDFDEFEDDDFEGDAELDDFLDEEETASKPEKTILDFIPLNLSSEAVDEARETIKQAASEIGSTVVGTAHKVSSIVKPSSDSGIDEVEDFEFTDFETTEDDFEDAEVSDENVSEDGSAVDATSAVDDAADEDK